MGIFVITTSYIRLFCIALQTLALPINRVLYIYIGGVPICGNWRPAMWLKMMSIFFHTCLEGHLCIDLGNPTVKFYTKRVKANKTGFLLMYLKLKWAFDLTSSSHLRVEEVKNFGWTLQKIDIHLLYVIIRCICTGGGAMCWFGPKRYN